ncbi:MAG: hypothetical protein IT249_04800 [Chitinophagaceae bacterium]|nr:hypothetical protein [Chitinophagaceae bacterium]
MQKIELTNNQYRLLLQLAFLGVEMIDNAALSEEEDSEETSPLLDEAVDLENFLIAHYKKFGVKDIVDGREGEDMIKYQPEFLEECKFIANSAYMNKAAEMASFQMGIRDFKEVNGQEALDNLSPEKGVENVMSYSSKYLEEIFEKGFANFYLRNATPSKIITFS